MAAVAWLPDAQNEVFEEDQVTTSSLAQVLQQAPVKDTHLIVHPDAVIVSSAKPMNCNVMSVQGSLDEEIQNYIKWFQAQMGL